jgi:hypothetical protein
VFKLLKEVHHSKLAILLQYIEARCILHNVCKEISKQYPDLPIFCVHDCIVTTIGNQDIILKIMKDKLIEITSNEPSFKTEFWLGTAKFNIKPPKKRKKRKNTNPH